MEGQWKDKTMSVLKDNVVVCKAMGNGNVN